MYQSILEDLKYYAEHGLGQISTYEASQIVDLLQDQHAEITMLRKMQPVVLTGDSVNSFALATEISETKAKLDKLSKENDALKTYKNYFADCYGQGYEVANYHLNGDLEPLDTFLDSAEAEYESVLSQNGSNEVKVPKGDGDG